MSKISTYKKKDYTITFGRDDVLFFDLEVKITEHNPTNPTYSLEIVRAQFSPELEFIKHLLSLMDTSKLAKVQDDINELLKQDLEPQLKSLFYAGDVDNSTDTL